MLQKKLDCIDTVLLTLRPIGGYNEPSLEEYALLVPAIPLVSSVAPLCDSRSTVSVESL